MEDKNQIKMPTRLQLINKLMVQFNKDYEGMLKKYSHSQNIELTEHLLQQLKHIEEYQKTKKEDDWKKYSDAETALLKKYRSKLQDYANAQFYKYFDFGRVFAHKDILTNEQFNSMKSAVEQSLSSEEIEWFLEDCKRLLSNSQYFLYLYDTGEDQPPVTLDAPISMADETDKGITKARQLLAIYYFLKASLGIEGRDSSSISGIARFIHLLTGTKFTTVQNSDIYKKYLQMPNYKKDSQLITDLKFIRPYFVDLGLDSAVKMIDEEINRAINELPFGERKKYKND